MELERIPEDKLSFVIQNMQGVNNLDSDKWCKSGVKHVIFN